MSLQTRFRGYSMMFSWILLAIALCCWWIDRSQLKKTLVQEQRLRENAEEQLVDQRIEIERTTELLSDMSAMDMEIVEIVESEDL